MKAVNLRPGQHVRIDGIENPVKFLSKEPCRCKAGFDYIFQNDVWCGQNGTGDLGCFVLTARQVREKVSV